MSNAREIIEATRVQIHAVVNVVFPRSFPVAEFAGSQREIPAEELFIDVGDMAMAEDDSVKQRVVEHLDLPAGSLDSMVVHKPERGVITIMAEPKFGGNSWGGRGV